MANPKIYYTDLSTYSVTASAGDIATHTSGSLRDYNYSTYWQSPNANSQNLIIDLGSAKTVTHVVLANHNFYSTFTPNGTLQLAGCLSSNFVSTTYDEYTAWIQSDDDVVYEFPAPFTARYLKFFWDGTLTTAPKAGEIWFPTELEFDTPYQFGYKKDNPEYVTSEKVALDGTILTSQAYAGRYLWELNFALQSNTLATNFKTFHRAVRGKLYPFFFLDADGTTVRYFHIEDYVPITTRRYNLNDIETLIFRTQQSNF
jgi:hypothetical protein